MPGFLDSVLEEMKNKPAAPAAGGAAPAAGEAAPAAPAAKPEEERKMFVHGDQWKEMEKGYRVGS